MINTTKTNFNTCFPHVRKAVFIKMNHYLNNTVYWIKPHKKHGSQGIKPDMLFSSLIQPQLHLRISLFNHISALIDEKNFQQFSVSLFWFLEHRAQLLQIQLWSCCSIIIIQNRLLWVIISSNPQRVAPCSWATVNMPDFVVYCTNMGT